MSRIRVLLADDHTLFRKGIRTLLSREADIEVVGEAENGSQSVEKVAELNADVVLVDIGMSGLSSFGATRQIKKIRPKTKILFPHDVRRSGLSGRVYGGRWEWLRERFNTKDASGVTRANSLAGKVAYATTTRLVP